MMGRKFSLSVDFGSQKGLMESFIQNLIPDFLTFFVNPKPDDFEDYKTYTIYFIPRLFAFFCLIGERKKLKLFKVITR